MPPSRTAPGVVPAADKHGAVGFQGLQLELDAYRHFCPSAASRGIQYRYCYKTVCVVQRCHALCILLTVSCQDVWLAPGPLMLPSAFVGLHPYGDGGGGGSANGWPSQIAAALVLPAQLSTGSQPQARQRVKSFSRPMHCSWDAHTGKPPLSLVVLALAYPRPRDLHTQEDTFATYGGSAEDFRATAHILVQHRTVFGGLFISAHSRARTAEEAKGSEPYQFLLAAANCCALAAFPCRMCTVRPVWQGALARFIASSAILVLPPQAAPPRPPLLLAACWPWRTCMPLWRPRTPSASLRTRRPTAP